MYPLLGWLAPFLWALFLTSEPRLFAGTWFHQAPPSTLQRKSPIEPGDTRAIQAGAQLFLNRCAACHGQKAGGSGNVPALSQGPVQSAPEGAIFWFIKKGDVENGMPSFALPARQRWELVAFIKGFNHSSASFQALASLSAGAPRAQRDLPHPHSPFTDFRFERPGQLHRIFPKDLPAPTPGFSAGNGPEVVPRPENAWPKVPPGFRVTLFASHLENPRLIRTAPNGDSFLAESRTGKLKVFRGLTVDGKPQLSEVYATGLNKPYGIAFYPPGASPKWLYVGDTDAVLRFPYKSGDLRASGTPQKVADLPHGGGHWTRDLQFSRDGKKLFVAVGSASNIGDPDFQPSEKDRGVILVMSPDGAQSQVFAYGIRNAGGGLAINPSDGRLWASVNERDGLGDDLVPDYITHIQEGGFYGWPWWYIGGNQDPRRRGTHPELRQKLIEPDVLLQPHHASLQLAFYDGKQFPAEYRGDIFAAQHGSWNRSVRTGYELVRVPLHHTGVSTGEYEDFMTGFVVDESRVWGRPVGVTVAADGALLVTDDGSKSIWRIAFTGR